MRSSSARDSFMVMIFAKFMPNVICPGPSMMLRPASPKEVPLGFAHALPEAVALAKGQFVNPVAGEFVALIKTGEAAVSGDVEGILRYNRAATTDRRSVINRFGVGVGPRNSDAARHALAQANRSGVIDRIAR